MVSRSVASLPTTNQYRLTDCRIQLITSSVMYNPANIILLRACSGMPMYVSSPIVILTIAQAVADPHCTKAHGKVMGSAESSAANDAGTTVISFFWKAGRSMSFRGVGVSPNGLFPPSWCFVIIWSHHWRETRCIPYKTKHCTRQVFTIWRVEKNIRLNCTYLDLVCFFVL